MKKITYYIYNIIFYSILGYIFENISGFIFGFNPNSGFANGPYSIIYGLSLTSMFFIYSKIEKMKTIKYKYLLFFTIPFIVLSIFEHFAGTTIELLYNIEYWNYENLKFNLGKYISLETSMIWGIFPILTYYFLKEKTDKIYCYVNSTIIYLLFIIMISDYIFVALTKFNL